MSGGSYSYICFTLEEECAGKMHDAETDLFVKDFVKVLHDLELLHTSGEQVHLLQVEPLNRPRAVQCIYWLILSINSLIPDQTA